MDNILKRLFQIKRKKYKNKNLPDINEIMSSIAHEIRTPLSAIKNCVQLIHERGNYNERDKKIINLCLGEIDRIEGFLEIFHRAFVQNKKSNRKEIYIKKEINNMIDFIGPSLHEKSILISSTFKLGNEKTFIDKDKLRQCLLNIIFNSIEAINNNGKIQIDVEDIYFKNKRKLRIIILDNGSGINDKFINRIFEPFFSTKSSGYGLGLNIVKKTIEEEGGTVTISNNETAGIKAELIIPA